jgi:homoserine kinase
LAIALSLYVEVEVEAADRLSVRVEGEGSDIPTDQSHLAARVAMDVAGTSQLQITVRSQIPVARGLGSSAALAVAAAAAAGSTDPLAVAAALDGHPDNAAASVLGGLVTATALGPRPFASRLALDPELVFVVVVPDRHLSTPAARAALPDLVPHHDASFNLGRMGMLLAGLADHRQLVREATEDRLHQTARTPLFPESPRLLAGMVDAGALASCWSGGGPSLLGICRPGSGAKVQAAADRLLAEGGVAGKTLLLHADTTGLVIDAEAGRPPQ